VGEVKYKFADLQIPLNGQVVSFKDDPGRTCLVAEVMLEDGSRINAIAAEGIKVGDKVVFGAHAPSTGNVMRLGEIPDGTSVFNLESRKGDGGSLARSSGASAFVSEHDEITNLVKVILPSRKTLTLDPLCLATIGVASGGGRLEKPFKKAGNKRRAMQARNRYYPRVRGTAMNAYDHPHGGKSLGVSSMVSRHAPPGRKVGHIGASRTGRKRGKSVKTEVE
jgi:large subunit ribosomal protein L2